MWRLVLCIFICLSLTGCKTYHKKLRKLYHPDKKKHNLIAPTKSENLEHLIEDGEIELFEMKEGEE